MKLTRLHLPGVAAALLMSTALAAHASSGTTAGTEVTNTISMSYTAGANSVTVDEAATRSFTVDRKVDFEIDSASELVTVDLGESTTGEGSASFTLRNLSNDAIGYALDIEAPTSEFLDSWRVLVDGEQHDLATAITVAQDADVEVVIEATFLPGAAAGNDYDFEVSANVTGHAQSTAADIADLTTTSTVWLFDSDEPPAGETAFRIVEPVVAATKAVRVVSQDPDFACASFDADEPAEAQAAIPGACIEYTITVENTGGASARGVSISDALPSQVSFVAFGQTGSFFNITEDAGTVTASAPDGSNLTNDSSQSFVIRATIN